MKEDINQQGTRLPTSKRSQRGIGLIRSEVNFARLPFFALSRGGLKKKGEIEYKDTIERGGEKLDILWRVTANTRYGFPGPFDKKVHKAVEFLISRRGFPVENPLAFSFYEICKLMHISNSGRTKKRIKDALARTKLAGIESKGAFYYKEEKRWIDDIFNLYDRVIFVGERLPNGDIADRNYIFLSDWYLKSLNSFYVKPLDFDYYHSLQSALSGRLYELLSIQFYSLHGKPYSVEYRKLCQLLPIVEQKYFSKAKENLDSAHQALRDTKFLTQVRWRETGKGRWIITYYPGKRAKEQFNKFRLERQLELELPAPGERIEAMIGNKEKRKLIKELEDSGIASSISVELVEKYQDRIPEKLEVFKWLIGKKSPLVKKNPAGFLRKSIEEDYQPPKEYVGYREREAKEQKERDLRERWLQHRKELIEQDIANWDKKPPEERVKGRLDFWILQQKLNLQRPTREQIQEKLRQLVDSLPQTDQEKRAYLENEHPENPPEDFE